MSYSREKYLAKMVQDKYSLVDGMADTFVYWRSLGLTVRVANALTINGIKTIEELKSYSLSQILRTPNLGVKSVALLCVITKFPVKQELIGTYRMISPLMLEQLQLEVKRLERKQSEQVQRQGNQANQDGT